MSEPCELAIVQLVHAFDWVAIYEDEVIRTVACWAHVKCAEHGAHVEAIVSYEGEMLPASHVDGFIECVPSDEAVEIDDDADG